VNTAAEYTGRLGYRPALDGLRAFAVMAVIVLHYGDAPKFFAGGFLGVDLFFVLSGFLITRLLLEERTRNGGNDVKGFYLRRAARLLPALMLVCFVILVDGATVRALGSLKSSVFSVGAALSYTTNWAIAFNISSVLNHTWSLSVEEQFYILWPLGLVLLHRWKGVRGVRIGAAIVVAFSALEMGTRSLLGVSAPVLYPSTDAHGAVMIMSGCLLATVLPIGGEALHANWIGRLSRRSILAVLAGLAVLLITLPWTSSFYYRGGYLIVAGLFCLLIARALQPGVLAKAVSVAPIVWVGRISYGLYLWHVPFYVALHNKTDLTLLQRSLIALVLTFAAATASYYLVEIPVRRAAVRYQRRNDVVPVATAVAVVR
jgi:peptidoglycan/LPS O-acetylase OafA/YrhL